LIPLCPTAIRGGLLAAGLAGAGLLPLKGTAQPAPRLLLAFSSFRDRPLHPRLYFYEHDGAGQGRPAGGIPPVDLRVDTHPTLARGGRLVACASELENSQSETRIWDRAAGQDVAGLAGLNLPDAVQIGAAISADGGWVAFASLRRPGPAGWNVGLYRLAERLVVEVPVNTDDDEHSPSLSGEARLLAFVSNRPGGGGLQDLHVFDRAGGRMLPTPGLNTGRRELDPALSADGRLLAFTSDRPGGAGSRDIYLYDLRQQRLLPLPGLNGIGIDQTPALTADGRYLAFVAERASGAGERDVYLYDRERERLLPTPELNSKAEDFDPAVIVLD